ncbi:hypothetical protein [Conexibacter sp. DBS9H8]|uniref:hypothetical protein n=1 Tax=Conexibacter sp. DBS9H8 TaxID=2937801 RepID=UPI00200CCAC7|nr:hypothetical protein [Conexibacter sp. DBS9H8]
MSTRALDRGEVIAAVGGILLGLSLFLGWYTLANRYAILAVCHGPGVSCSGWNALEYIRFLLIIAAVAPLVLIWVILRGRALTWPRGELTAVVALCALTLIVFRGIIDKPGYPRGEIGVGVGWFVALAGGLLIFLGAITRTHESNVRRKPPGVL